MRSRSSCTATRAYARGRALVERLREEIPRQFFDVADPGGDRLAHHRARDDQGEAQGRAREVLRRRHHAQAQAAREAEGGQEADEAGRRGRGPAGGVPGRAQPRRGRNDERRPPPLRPPAVLRLSLRLLRLRHARRPARRPPRATSTRCSPSWSSSASSSRPALETVFLGGGTPTFLEPDAAAPPARGAAGSRRADGRGEPGDGHAGACTRCSATAASRGSPWARRASSRTCSRCSSGAPRPDVVRRAFYHLRDASFDNISLDLIYGIPGQSAADLDRDLEAALGAGARAPVLYELEAKPGTRFTHAHGEELSARRRRWRAISSDVVEC